MSHANSEILVIANSEAGSSDEGPVQQALDFLQREVTAEIVTPQGPEELKGAVAAARGRDIVIFGGDGSVNGLLQCAHDLNVLDRLGAIGLVPSGTGNDFARTLGLPLDNPAQAAWSALHGQTKRADLVLDHGDQVLMNAAHLGVAARATLHAEQVKGFLGKAGYAVGAASAGLSNTGWHLKVVVDGEVVHDGQERVLTVSVANGPSVGGGTRVAPEASIDDGLLDVVVVQATGPRARASYAMDLRKARHLDRADVHLFRGSHVEVTSVRPGEEFLVNVDGDLSEAVQSQQWRVLKHAWTVRTHSDASRP